jgi:hypothetical protein
MVGKNRRFADACFLICCSVRPGSDRCVTKPNDRVVVVLAMPSAEACICDICDIPERDLVKVDGPPLDNPVWYFPRELVLLGMPAGIFTFLFVCDLDIVTDGSTLRAPLFMGDEEGKPLACGCPFKAKGVRPRP